MPSPYKRVLVIGATSGIGLALASRFVKEGSSVIVVGRRKENLEQFVHEHGKDKAAAIPFDISNLSQIPTFVQNITSTYPDVDLVFLNSGVQRGLDFAKPDSVDMSVLENEMLVNYTAIMHLTQAFLPFLLSKPEVSRSLLYTTSNLAIVPMVRCPNYSASKAALHAMVLCLRAQLQDTNVKVMELLPPAVQTELHDAKHQPDIKDGGKVGMPLDKFTDLAYAGIAGRQEQTLIGSDFFGELAEAEKLRQKAFWDLWEKVRGH